MSAREVVVLVIFIVAAVTTYFFRTPHLSSILPTPINQSSPSAQLSNCHTVSGLPDKNCTPGLADPRVTQDNIQQTICVSGYTKTVRPPVSYTSPLKSSLMVAYGDNDSPSNYELDHLIPLEVGGHPTDQRNLWPEPGTGLYNFHNKDGFENYLHRQVCSGALSLTEAQMEISTNWVQYWLQDGSP